uniref:Sugar phosphate transporter domain-containing protein n=1 Tax=Biomphalaria glabrata TaxID=6526 RepID=A0A2C9JPH4_BIOGL
MVSQNHNNNRLVFLCSSVNICSTIALVLLNKWIYIKYDFPNITLSCIHFVVISLGLLICRGFDIIQPIRLPFFHMIPFVLLFCALMVLNYFSLQSNTVVTYQIINTMTIPCILFVENYFYGKHVSTKVKLTWIPVTIGVVLSSVYDVKFNITGIIFASLAVLINSLYQVLVAERQHYFQVNSVQLLYYQAPRSALLLLFVIPFFEPSYSLDGFYFNWSLEVLVAVFLSACVAFVVNVSLFWLITNTTPLIYNMIRYLKFRLTLLAFFTLFHDKVHILQLLGTLTTVAGVLAYTHIQREEIIKKNSLPTTIDIQTKS